MIRRRWSISQSWFRLALLASRQHPFFSYFITSKCELVARIHNTWLQIADNSISRDSLSLFPSRGLRCFASLVTSASSSTVRTFDMCFFFFTRSICRLGQSACTRRGGGEGRKNICANRWEKWSARILWIRFQVQMPMRFPRVSLSLFLSLPLSLSLSLSVRVQVRDVCRCIRERYLQNVYCRWRNATIRPRV